MVFYLNGERKIDIALSNHSNHYEMIQMIQNDPKDIMFITPFTDQSGPPSAIAHTLKTCLNLLSLSINAFKSLTCNVLVLSISRKGYKCPFSGPERGQSTFWRPMLSLVKYFDFVLIGLKSREKDLF